MEPRAVGRQRDAVGAAATEIQYIADGLAAADLGNARLQRALIASHWNRADLSDRSPGRSVEAAAHWSQALAIARALADTGRLAPTDAYFVETLEQRLAATREDPPSEP